MTGRTRTRLAGCQTLDEAMEKIAIFLDGLHADHVRKFQSDALTDRLDVDVLDAELQRFDAEWQLARPALLQQAREALLGVRRSGRVRGNRHGSE